MMNTLTFNLTNEQKREIFNEVLFNDTINKVRKEILFMKENNLQDIEKLKKLNEVLFNDTINKVGKEILFMKENNLQDIEKLKKLDDKDFRIITNIFLKKNNENVTQKETMIYAIHEYLDNITI